MPIKTYVLLFIIDEKAEKDLFQKTDFLGTFSSSTSSTTNTNGLEPKTPSSVVRLFYFLFFGKLKI